MRIKLVLFRRLQQHDPKMWNMARFTQSASFPNRDSLPKPKDLARSRPLYAWNVKMSPAMTKTAETPGLGALRHMGWTLCLSVLPRMF
jgi:hypothetical protein